MFRKILIANRGEIAVRIIRACQELGIATVAIHSPVDARAMHVRIADESVCIGPNNISKSYLNIPSIISACEITDAEAVHPGYGFLSENYRFAKILEEHGIVFIGPKPEHIKLMGNKIEAKAVMQKMGVPTVPGSERPIQNLDEAKKEAEKIGYPIIIKATEGGGGKGMKIVTKDTDLDLAVTTAKLESKKFFGNDEIYIEKYIDSPRHIEIQLIADKHRRCLHLGERECSLQRNNQKILEEAPSPILEKNLRDSICEISVNALQKLEYYSVGTIEFLYKDQKFYFLEMNTRIQVEHPVTEAITGMDLVKEQISIAAGKKLAKKQSEIDFTGHAIECRINAEDPFNFAPCPGIISLYHSPGGNGVRVDSSIYSGYTVPSNYDSLIAKLIVHDKDRESCIRKLQRSLKELVVDGIKTTTKLHEQVVATKDFKEGKYHIGWIGEFISNTR